MIHDIQAVVSERVVVNFNDRCAGMEGRMPDVIFHTLIGDVTENDYIVIITVNFHNLFYCYFKLGATYETPFCSTMQTNCVDYV